jgi:hypothetical protein
MLIILPINIGFIFPNLDIQSQKMAQITEIQS